MVKVFLHGQIINNMMEIIFLVKDTEKEYLDGQMEKYLKVSG